MEDSCRQPASPALPIRRRRAGGGAKPWRIGAMLLAVLVAAARAEAAVGDCGHPVSDAVLPTAQDALAVLRAAVGQTECPPWTCDTDDNGIVAADDALRVLRAAVGVPVELTCPPPPTTTTTTTVTSTTTTLGSLQTTCIQQGTLVWRTETSETNNPIAGELLLRCDDPTAPQTACRCDIGTFAPVVLPGLGTLCVTQTDQCGGGWLDCEGGPPSQSDLLSDHDIGACSGNPDCAAACEGHCQGLGAEVLNSGCEGFCAGGVNAGLPCTGNPGCPGSVCNGRVAKHGQRCACHCVGHSGSAADAGYLQCRIGLHMTLEKKPPCGDGDEQLLLGEQCLTLTSGRLAATLAHANDATGKIEVTAQQGASLTCPVLTESTAGLTLVGAVPMIDSPLGDLLSSVRIACQ